jgi:hypothetical protein
MYNTKHICDYHAPDILEEEEKTLSKEEKEFIVNCLYRNDLLYIFNLEDFETEFQEKAIFDELYEKIKENEFFKFCMKTAANNVGLEDDKLGLVLLYSFDYLFLMHPCVSEFLETGTVSEEKQKLLKIHLFHPFHL